LLSRASSGKWSRPGAWLDARLGARLDIDLGTESNARPRRLPLSYAE
jgi:hypothetical protein